VINAWSRNLPPPPPVGVDVPFNNSTWADKVGKTLDVINWTLSILDAVADLFELGGMAAVTGPLGLIGSVIGSIVQMPLLWATTDAYANTNGQIQGAADAIQDMADQFSNDNLDRTPLSQWPAVKVPTPHFSNNPQPDATQEAWRG